MIAENFEALYAYLLSHPCIDCGESDPIVLQFDHVRGKKLYNISQAVCGSKLRWQTVLSEIAKCDVRCANCHTRKTAKESGWRKHLAGLALVGRHLHGKQVQTGSTPVTSSDNTPVSLSGRATVL